MSDTVFQAEEVIAASEASSQQNVASTAIPSPDATGINKLKIKKFINEMPEGLYLHPEQIAHTLSVTEEEVRVTIAEMATEDVLGRPIQNSRVNVNLPPPTVVFVPSEANKKIGEEPIDKTMERLKKVDDKAVTNWVKENRRQKKSTAEALLGIKSEDMDPAEYEWTPIDFNLEACYAGWDTIGIRIRGKRQMRMFLSVAALKRALFLALQEEHSEKNDSKEDSKEDPDKM